jgi:two-component system sensor histidine kinase KdpD
MTAKDEVDPHNLPETLARTLRHEVGDLLQTVYAAVAILQRRLAAEATLERRVLLDLRSRAEGCKRLLDNMSDLVCQINLSLEPVDLAQVAVSLVTVAAHRYPKLEIQASPSAPVFVPADEKRIAQVGEILLTQACEAARAHVSFQTRGSADSGESEWTVTDDRPTDGPLQFEEESTAFEKILDGGRGIELTLAQRLVRLHGGRIVAEQRAEGGFSVHVWLPGKVPALGS